jgi:hypothetical protein
MAPSSDGPERSMRWKRPSRSRVTSPARSSTRRCLEIAGADISNGSASSRTLAAPVARRSSIFRRAECDSAPKIASSASS